MQALKWYVGTAAALLLVGLVWLALSPGLHYVVCDAYGPSLMQSADEPIEWREPPWYATQVGPGCYEIPGWAIWEF
jgi:hypothetical protein